MAKTSIPSTSGKATGLAAIRQRRELEELTTAARFQQSGFLAEAEEIHARVLASNPRSFESLNALAGLYMQLGRIADTIALFENALPRILDKGHRTALLSNLALALGQPSQTRQTEALKYCEQALAINPAHVDAWNNKGNILRALNRPGEAIACYERVLKQRPSDANVRWNKALCHLALGDFSEGWPLYESRWQGFQKAHVRNFGAPLWLGKSPLAGKTLLLHAEQGYGDTLQAVRFVPSIREQGARIILEVPPPLATLLAGFEGIDELVVRGSPLPAFDCHCPLMSLPLACGISTANIPATRAYVHCDPAKLAAWDVALGERKNLRVGLAWSGNPTHLNDVNRSIGFEPLATLLALPFDFHCLHKEIREPDRAALAQHPGLRTHEERLVDFSDTAALIAEMDVVISVDTATLHLAGALGKNTWALLPFAPDYRWMLDRDDSPWYPTVRLFRQPSQRDWASVIGRVSQALLALAKGSPD